MPQIGWLDSHNKIVSFDDGIALAKEFGEWENFPPEVLIGMRENLTKERPDAISVTQLLSCPRKVYLEGTLSFAVPPTENYPQFRGMVVHSVLEQVDGEALVEERVEKEYRGVIISGQPDNIRLVKGTRTLLRDWKSTKSLPMYDYAYTSHQQQVNLYRWLLDLDPRLTDLEIVYVSMEGVKMIPLKRGGKNRYGRNEPNQIWTDEEVEAFLDKHLLLLDAQRKYQTPVAYHNVDEENLWQCAYCPVREQCYVMAADEAREAWSRGESIQRTPPRQRKTKRK